MVNISHPLRSPLTTDDAAYFAANETPNFSAQSEPHLKGDCEYPAWWVWKFGGSSLASYEKLLSVSNLVNEQLGQWDAAGSEVQGNDVHDLHQRSSETLVVSPHTPASLKRSHTAGCRRLDSSRCVSQVESSHSVLEEFSSGGVSVAQNHLAVVVSALGGVTNILESALQSALGVLSRAAEAIKLRVSRGGGNISPRSENCVDRFISMSSTIIGPVPSNFLFSHFWAAFIAIHMEVVFSIRAASAKEDIESMLKPGNYKRHMESDEFEECFMGNLIDLICTLQSVSLTGSASKSQCAFVLGFGELWSVKLLAIILGSQLVTSNSNVVPIVLNARDVLTVRQISKPRDVRDQLNRTTLGSNPNLMNKKYPTTRFDDYLVELHPSPSGFLPGLGRSSLLQMETPSCQTASAHLKCCEEYELSCVRSEGGTIVNHHEAAAYPLLDSWAFPPIKSLPPNLFPPTGPVTVDTESTKPEYLPRIDWLRSYKNLAAWFHSQLLLTSRRRFRSGSLTSRRTSLEAASKPVSYLLLITGFICKTLDNLPTTLQRNGSDTSAVAFASLLRAEGVTIWSDVAGIYTGDPRYCVNARPLEFLSYEEALELAGIGARVLHPASLLPCIHMHIPLLLKSTFQPTLRGTTIADFSHVADRAKYGKIVSKVSNICLFTLSNFPLTSLTNFASRLFAAVEKGGGKPLFISQGLSSSAISVAVASAETDAVLNAVVEAFRHDSEDYGSKLQYYQMHTINDVHEGHLKLAVDSDCSVLSVVGRGQISFVGATAAWCEALRNENVSIKAVSQSSSELSTSFVIAKESEEAALRALHAIVVQSEAL